MRAKNGQVSSEKVPTGRFSGEGDIMESRLFDRLGRFSVRRRWFVIGAWAVVLVVMGSFAGSLTGRLTSGGFEVPGSESITVRDDLQNRFTSQYPYTALVVVRNDHATVDEAGYRNTVEGIAARLRSTQGVGNVQSFYNTKSLLFVSKDRRTTYLIAGLKGDQNEVLHVAGRVAESAPRAAPSGYEVSTGGLAPFYNRFNEVSRQDLEKAERLAFPITLIVLVLAFGTIIAAGLPILLGIFSLVVTLGALYFLAGVTNMSVYVTNTASIIGIGVGIDYSLFVVTRYREELRRGRPVPDAIVRSIASSGRAVALSGATVIVALAGMFLVNIQAFRSMAVGSMSVVAVAVLAAITLLPAVLSVAGLWVDRLRVPFVKGAAANTESGFWHRWAIAVMRRPWAFLAASLAVLLTVAIPFGVLRLGQPGPSVLPANEQPRVATERLAHDFGAGVTGPIDILVSTPGGALRMENLSLVADLTKRLQRDREVKSVLSLTSLLPPNIPTLGYVQVYSRGIDGVDPRLKPYVVGLSNWSTGATFSRITAVSKHAPESPAAEDLIRRIRDRYVVDAGLETHVWVGGSTAFNLDLENEITRRLPVVVAAVLALSFLLLMAAFRSVVLPLKAILMNLLSVGASYGVIVALFQWGWGAGLLGFTSEHHIEAFVPMFLFSILFGLSMDYEVFLMSRMREEYQRTGSNDLAVAHGLEGTARTITSAALIMVTVFLAFAVSRVVPFKEMGIGLAAAVLIDATLVRTVLVPAAMKLMGRWNWWMPARLDRWLPRISLEVSDELEAQPLAEPALV
jgi:RND superfamily putative drug exporter